MGPRLPEGGWAQVLQALLTGWGWASLSGRQRLGLWGMALYLIKTGLKTGVAEALVLATPVCTAPEKQLCDSTFFAPHSLPLAELIVGTRLQQI